MFFVNDNMAKFRLKVSFVAFAGFDASGLAEGGFLVVLPLLDFLVDMLRLRLMEWLPSSGPANHRRATR